MRRQIIAGIALMLAGCVGLIFAHRYQPAPLRFFSAGVPGAPAGRLSNVDYVLAIGASGLTVLVGIAVCGWVLARDRLTGLASATAPASERNLLADICALTATVYGLALWTLSLGSERWLYTSVKSVGGANAYGLLAAVLLGLASGLALVGHRRLSGIAGLAWISFYLAGALDQPSFGLVERSGVGYDMHWIAFVVVPLACYMVMIVAPGATRRRSQRLGWLLGAWLVGGILAPPAPPLELFAWIGFENVLLIAIFIMGVCLLAIDPWRPVAFALALVSFGLGAWTWASIAERYEYLPMTLTTVGPVLLMAGAAVKHLSEQRSPVRDGPPQAY